MMLWLFIIGSISFIVLIFLIYHFHWRNEEAEQRKDRLKDLEGLKRRDVNRTITTYYKIAGKARRAKRKYDYKKRTSDKEKEAKDKLGEIDSLDGTVSTSKKLKDKVDELTAQVADLTTERNGLQGQVDTLQSQSDQFTEVVEGRDKYKSFVEELMVKSGSSGWSHTQIKEVLCPDVLGITAPTPTTTGGTP